jgi:hypothetical protein
MSDVELIFEQILDGRVVLFDAGLSEHQHPKPRLLLSDRIYLWPAQGAPNTPMYAAFAVGQGWDSGAPQPTL